MSGSPIYLTDDSGRSRMIGAFAYGWPLTKDPVAGVQPIEYMLRLPAGHASAETASAGPATRPSGRGKPVNSPGSHRGLNWSLSDAGYVPFLKSPPKAKS